MLVDPDGNETIGPSLDWEQGTIVSPFNRENGFAADVIPDAVSGHGTHVVGLIASAAPANAVLFDPASQQSWLRLSVVAFSPGKRAISKYTVPHFNEALLQIRLYSANVVNMSVRFGKGAAEGLRALITAREQTLFVVAAGNEGANFNQPNPRGYPAMLGGELSNVLTVGAEDGAGNLAAFSNRGADTVELVAPGCNLSSSLDGAIETPLSGTSQASPIVSLAAALLSRQGYTARQIKARLIQSGDLLSGLLIKTDGVVSTVPITRDSHVPVKSRSRLNVAKAQFAKYDYLRYRDDQGSVVEVVGRLGTRAGPSCGPDRDFQDVVAFKRLATDRSGWCFWRNQLQPAAIPDASSANLNFEVDAELDATGTPQPKVGSLTGLALDRVEEFVVSVERADLTWKER